MMRQSIFPWGIVVLLAGLPSAAEPAEKPQIYPKLRDFLAAREREFDQIASERAAALDEITAYIQGRMATGEPARIIFICTHNSRRSHMAQIWSATAAVYHGIKNVETYSGGTESTAFNPRAIAALRRAGLEIQAVEAIKNPRYEVRFGEGERAMVCFSKAYADPPNPRADFLAVLTCSQADQSCPRVMGASARVSLPYEDPKVADDTPDEESRYDERSRQVCREMLYVFSRVGK